MAAGIYFCVVEDWSENVTVASFGGANMKQERVYATSCYKTCHGIFNTLVIAQRKAAEIRAGIARNRAAQAPQVATKPPAEERHLDEQASGNPPIDITDPEKTMTAQQIRAALRGW